MSKQVRMLKKFFKGFSLVELIIVIAIIAILSVAGFLTLQKRISQSRDSKRLGDLETIEKSLTVNYTDQDTSELYSMPDENNDGSGITSGEIDGETVAYKGTFGSGAIDGVDSLNEVPVDPLDDDRYAYGVTEDQQYFQIAAVLENGDKVSYRFMNRAYAADKKSTVRGNYDGLMVYTSGDTNYISNIPSLIFNNTGSLTNTGEVSYVVDGSSNLAYGDTTQKESFEEVLRKTYGLSGDTNVSFVNTGVQKVKDAIEKDILNDTMKNSLGGNEGVIESKLEESGVSVESSDDGCGSIPTEEGLCNCGLCVFNLSGSSQTGTNKKLMTYQPSNSNVNESVPEKKWGCRGDSISATNDTDGQSNTNTIISKNCGTAAQYCDQLSISVNGRIYDDWYLPARYELDAMCNVNSNGTDACNNGSMSIGGLIGDSHLWASTEKTDTAAWQLTNDGTIVSYSKSSSVCNVQCVRSVDQ